MLRRGDRLVILADNGADSSSLWPQLASCESQNLYRWHHTTSVGEHRSCCAGKPVKEQQSMYTNSEYIGEYPCRWGPAATPLTLHADADICKCVHTEAGRSGGSLLLASCACCSADCVQL